MNKKTIKHSSYTLKPAHIIETKYLTDDIKYFKLRFTDGTDLDYTPGQFVMVSMCGVGEVPISISSTPTRKGFFELVIRKAGKVTSDIHSLKTGDKIGIRGPMGRKIPLSTIEGKDLIFVAGGLGIVPLRSFIDFVLDNRRDFGKVEILLGCKTPEEILFKDEIKDWEETLNVEFNCTVDKADPKWKGNVGLITSLIPSIFVYPERTYAIVCGPPIMYKFVIKALLEKGIKEDHIILSLERHMKCGVGKCGHCQIGNYYCCQDGPVFFYHEIKNNWEAL